MVEETEKRSLDAQTISALGLRPDLVGEFYVRRGLSEILQPLRSVKSYGLNDSTLATIQLWMEQDDADHSLVQERRPIPGTSGLKSEYPPHALLLELGFESSLHPKRGKLAAHALLIANALQQRVQQQETQDTPGVWNNRTQICRRVRILSTTALELLIDIPDDPVVLRLLAKNQLNRALPKDLEEFYIVLERSLAYALGYRHSPPRDVRGVGIREKPKPREYPMGLAEFGVGEGDDDDSCFTMIVERGPGSLSARDSINRGLAPEEEEGGTKLIKIGKNLDLAAGDSPQLALWYYRDKVRHVAKRAQLLPGSWNRLSDFEVLMLMRGLMENVGEEPQACMLLTLSFMTGTPTENLLNTQVYDSNEALPQATDPQRVQLVAQRGTWHRGVIRPESAKSPRPEWETYLEPSMKRLAFPIPKFFWEILSPVMARVSQGPAHRIMLFPALAGSVIETAKSILSSINRRHQTRLTLLRVQQNLFHALVEGEGDIAEASLITGQLPPAGQPASLYYHHVSNANLLDKYKAAMSKSPVEIEFIPHVSLMTRSWGVGSRICIRTDVLKVLVNDLRGAVIHARDHWTSRESWIDFHNAFTRYVVMMLMFATGHRAVKDPLPYAEDINWQRGLVIIDDKSGEHLHKERIIPLPRVCQSQLKLYSDHSTSAIAKLAISRPQESWDRLPFFYFLTTELRWQSVQASTLMTQLQNCFDLPLNINRHLLRTRLRQSDVSGGAVDAFMGHWAEGQSPFGRYSSMDPLRYQQSIREVTEPLMRELGWSLERGLG